MQMEWMWRIMEIRKNPKCATEEEIIKLTDDILYGTLMTKAESGVNNVTRATNLISVENVSQQ